MGFINYAIGGSLVILGMFISVTIIGAIIGIPMMAIGSYLIYRERNKSAQRIIRDGIAEGLKKAKEASDTSTLPVVNEDNTKEDLKKAEKMSETNALVPNYGNKAGLE